MQAVDRSVQSARITFLATPAFKERLISLASEDGVSVAEFVRRRVLGEDEDQLSAEEQRELAMLVGEVGEAIPRINASLVQMSDTIRALRAENDAFFRDKGLGQ